MNSGKMLAIVAVALGLSAASRTAAAQSGVATFGGQGMGMTPYTSPYLNPYANPYLYNAPKGPVGATMVFMAGQQSIAMAAQQRAQIAYERDAPRGRNRSPMGVPGGGAARFFGGGSGPVGPADQSSDGRFQRHGRYFRPNGD